MYRGLAVRLLIFGCLVGCAGTRTPPPTTAAVSLPTSVAADREWTDCGRVRVDGRHFLCSDGSAFAVIGENRINVYDRAWNWQRMSATEYVRYAAEHGIRVLRVFVVSDVENEERGGRNAGVLEPELGRYDEAVAREFDAIFRAAEQQGVKIVLVAFALGFSEQDDWKSWHDNPYSAARGGPAATRYEFFELPAARAAAARRLQWLAARYAASPALLAIDLLNEPEWDGEIPEVSWTDWARAMAAAWRAADAYGRPVTVGSVGLHWNVEGDEREWWASDACDVVQWHLYGAEVYDVHALAAEMTRKVRETWHYGKPVLVGEFAYGGEPKPAYDHTHVGLWSAAFAGAGVLAHSAPPFNVDSDEFMTPARAAHYAVLGQVLDAVGRATPGGVTATGDVSAWRLDGHGVSAIWLLAPRDRYGTAVSGIRVTLDGLAPGAWRAAWRDDVTGRTLRTERVTSAADRPTVLEAPPFREHVVVTLQRDGGG